MANRLRPSRPSRFAQLLEGVCHRIPIRRGEGAGDGSPPAPSAPSSPPAPSPPPAAASTSRRPYEPYLVGIRGHFPRTSVWRGSLTGWPDDYDGVLTASSARRLSPSDVEKDEAGKGLPEDREIIWPPMVIVMNTSLKKDDKDLWKGMNNQELLDWFGEYKPIKAHHACGPSGQLGISVLEFEMSTTGYIEAERLHRHFLNQGTGRKAWKALRPQFVPYGERQLFGFLARQADLEVFNKHRHGENYLNYEMRSYNDLRKKMVETEQRSKAVEETLGVFVRSKVKEKHPKYEQEIKYQEEFFHRQIEDIHKATKDKKKLFKKLLQQERSKAQRFDVDSGTTEDRKLRKEHVQKFINCQAKDVAEFKAERDELIKVHEEKKMKVNKEYMEKDSKLERGLEAAVTGLEQVELDKLIKEHKGKRLKLKKETMKKELELERGLGAALMALIDKHMPTTFETSLLP